jgi:hypothetical protein
LVKVKNSPPLDITDIQDVRWNREDVRKFFYGKRKRLTGFEEIVGMSAT